MSRIDVDQALRDLDSGTTPDWIAAHLRAYLSSGGSEGHLWDSTPAGGPGLLPTLVLTTTGRRSGRQYLAPLIYAAADDSFVIVASKGGAPENPRWYNNLVAMPQVGLQVGRDSFTAVARTATGDERRRLWAQVVALFPPYADYQQRTAREIPLVVLTRSSAA